MADLAPDRRGQPDEGRLAEAIGSPDVVVVENVLTMPVDRPASLALAAVLRGRPALLHHHDPPWLVPGCEHVTALPVDDPAWQHVVISRRAAAAFAARGIETTVIYNGFDVDPPAGDRAATRGRLGVAADEPLLLHPVRAIPRKNVPAALALAEAVGGTYWLPGPAEDGYAPTLERLLAATTARVVRTPVAPTPQGRGDAYAAADAVLYPSVWEGFGLPPVEAALHRRPAAVGTYPVAVELADLGFQWLPIDDPAPLARLLADPTAAEADLARNRSVAVEHLSHAAMRARLGTLFEKMGL